jgi:hypothetical protein
VKELVTIFFSAYGMLSELSDNYKGGEEEGHDVYMDHLKQMMQTLPKQKMDILLSNFLAINNNSSRKKTEERTSLSQQNSANAASLSGGAPSPPPKRSSKTYADIARANVDTDSNNELDDHGRDLLAQKNMEYFRKMREVCV